MTWGQITRKGRAGAAPYWLTLIAVLFWGCAKRDGEAHERVLHLSQRNESASLDPAKASLPDDFFVIRALGEGLLAPAPNGGEPQPAAAERYDISPDGLTYTFHLRGDGRWSNGERVTAGDFLASYQRLLSPETASPKADLFFAVKNARAFATGALRDFGQVGFGAPDDHTLIVTLAAPNPRFPLYVASGPWIPVNLRVVAAFGRNWTDATHYVGNGPFGLAEWRSQQRIVVRKNPQYRAAGEVQLDEMQFVRVDDENAEELAYRSGQLDVTLAVPHTKLEVYARDRPAELHRMPLAETRYLAFNVNKAALADPRVRRALAFAVDRTKIVERVLLGGQMAATTFIPPVLKPGGRSLLAGDSSSQTSPASRLLPSGHEYAPADARRLFNEAGFGARRPFPKLEISAWSRSQAPVLEAIQAMWRETLGIETTIAIREAKVHLTALRGGDYDVAFVTTLLDVLDPVTLLDGFTAGAADNFPHWQDQEYDAAIARAGKAATREALWAELNTAETRLLTAAPVTPIYFNVRNYLRSPRVQGWQEDALWTRYYLNLTIHEK